MLLTLHRWLGVAVCAFVLIVSLSGLLLLWADDYRHWRFPELPETVDTSAPDPAVLQTIVSAAGSDATTIALPSRELPAYHVYLRDGSDAFYHPYSGELLDSRTWLDTLPSFLFEAHVNLFAGSFGHLLVGLCGCVLLLMIVTGAWLWWRNRRVFPLRSWLPSSTTDRQLRRAHTAQGVWLAPLALVIVFSGIALVFPEPIQSALNSVLGARGAPYPAADALTTETAVNWRAALDRTSRAFPSARLRFVTPPAEPGRPIVLRLKQAGELHPNGRSYLVLDPPTGAILQRIDALARGNGPIAFNALYPLHAGKTGWFGYRALLAVLCLVLIYLAVSGSIVFVRRQLR